jgi:hypothetical protein
MHLLILAVPDCPNARVLEDRIAAMLGGFTDLTMSRQVITSQDDAVRWEMRGSPTLLIDGADPFARPGQPFSMSCQLYHDKDDGVPTTGQLHRVIEDARAAPPGTTDHAWLKSLGRLSRTAPADPQQLAVHQVILHSFIEHGSAPTTSELVPHAAPFELSRVLSDLAEGDYLALGPDHEITAAYPFSGLPTRHQVHIAGRPAVSSMCAIDALGISAMTGLPALIESTDPATGEAITVTVDRAASTWRPATTVVYVGHTATLCTGPSAAVCCGSMNFFATRSNAEAWAAAHPHISGGFLTQDRAIRAGISIFGTLLISR